MTFSMITSSYKTGKNRAEMRIGSILALIIFFFLNNSSDTCFAAFIAFGVLLSRSDLASI